MAKHMDRAKSRYGKNRSKSHADKDPSDWTHEDAKAYMNSKEGQEHQAMQSRAQELMQQESEQSPQTAAPNPGAAATMPAQGA